jgi:hypothetical protein
MVSPIDNNGVEGKIACSNNNQLYVMNADFGGQTDIGPGLRSCLAGNKLAYDLNDQIYESDNKGSSITQLTFSGMNRQPQYPYNGNQSKLIYWRQAQSGVTGGRLGDFIRHSDKQNLTFNVGNLNDWFWWGGFGYSTDGSEILYIASSSSWQKEIWIVNVASKTIVDRFDYTSDIRSTQFVRSLSPDNKSFLLSRGTGIYRVDRSTKNQTCLTENMDKGDYQILDMYHPFYSNDMRNLYFTAKGPNSAWAVYRIYADVDDSPVIYVGPGIAMSFSDGYQSTEQIDVAPAVTIESVEQVDLPDQINSNPVKVVYNLGDTNRDATDLQLWYRVYGAGGFVQTENFVIPSNQSSNGLGLGLHLYWNVSQEDIAVNGTYQLKLVPVQRKDSAIGTVAFSEPIYLQANRKPKVEIVSMEGDSKDITFTYNISDPDGDKCSVELQYDLFDGLGYRPATSLSGEVKLLDTAENNETTTYQLIWQSLDDVNRNVEDARVKLVPTDGKRDERNQVVYGLSDETGIFALANENLVPEVTELTILKGQLPPKETGEVSFGQDILFKYYLDDPEGDPCTLSFQVDYHDGQGFQYTNNITEYKSTSETCFVWHSYNDIQMKKKVTMKAIPNDGRIAEGKAREYTFWLNNENHAPELKILSAELVGDRVEITYEVNDPDKGDLINVSVASSTDNGENWTPATDYAGDWQNVIPWNRWLEEIWNLLKVRFGFAMNDGETGSYRAWLRSCGVQVAQTNLGEDPNKDATKKQVMSCKVVKVYGGLIVVEVKVSDGDIERTEYINLIFENYKISLSILQSDEHVEIESDKYKYNEIGAVVGLNETHKKIILPLIITIDKRLDSGKITITKEYSGSGQIDFIPSGEIAFNIDGQVNTITTPSDTISWELPTTSNRFKNSNNMILYVVGKKISSKRDDVIINLNLKVKADNETIDQDIKVKLTCCRPIYGFYQREEYNLEPFNKKLYDIADNEHQGNSYILNDREQYSGNTIYYLHNKHYVVRYYRNERTDISILKSALQTLGCHIYHSGHTINRIRDASNTIKKEITLSLSKDKSGDEAIDPYDKTFFNNLKYSSFFIRTCKSFENYVNEKPSTTGRYNHNVVISTNYQLYERSFPPSVYFEYILKHPSATDIDFSGFIDFFTNHLTPQGDKYLEDVLEDNAWFFKTYLEAKEIYRYDSF